MSQNAAKTVDTFIDQLRGMHTGESVLTKLHELLSPTVEGIPLRTDLAREWRMRLGVTAQAELPQEYVQLAEASLNEHRARVQAELSVLRELAESNPLSSQEERKIKELENAISTEENAGMDLGMAVAGI